MKTHMTKLTALIMALVLLLTAAMPAMAATKKTVDGVYDAYQTALTQNIDPAAEPGIVADATADMLTQIAELVGAKTDGVETADPELSLALLIAKKLEKDSDPQTAFDAWAVIAAHYGKTVKGGSDRQAVKDVQTALLAHDANSLPQYGADGKFGKECKAAVKAFQTAVGLPVTGTCDAATYALLTAQAGMDPVYALMSATAKALDDGRSMDSDYTTTLWITTTDTNAYAAVTSGDETALAKAKLDMAYAIAVLLVPQEKAETKTASDTKKPATKPSKAPEKPDVKPTEAPSTKPTEVPTDKPTEAPSAEPTEAPTEAPTAEPTEKPHEHKWVDVTDIVDVPEEGHYETVHYEAGTHTETIQHAEEGHYETVEHPAVTHTETVEHAEEGHYETVTVVDKEETTEQKWVVDKEAWTQTTEKKELCGCNGCGRTFNSFKAYTAHSDNVMHALMDGDMDAVRAETNGGDGKGCGSWSAIWKDVPLATPIEHPEEGHYETVTVPAVTHTEQKWVVDKAAWTETVTVTDKAAWTEKVWVVDKAAWTETITVTDTEAHDEQVWVVDKPAHKETVVVGQRCETCGETKSK